MVACLNQVVLQRSCVVIDRLAEVLKAFMGGDHKDMARLLFVFRSYVRGGYKEQATFLCYFGSISCWFARCTNCGFLKRHPLHVSQFTMQNKGSNVSQTWNVRDGIVGDWCRLCQTSNLTWRIVYYARPLVLPVYFPRAAGTQHFCIPVYRVFTLRIPCTY